MVNYGYIHKINNHTRLTVTATNWKQASVKSISIVISAPIEENIKQSFAATKQFIFLSFL